MVVVKSVMRFWNHQRTSFIYFLFWNEFYFIFPALAVIVLMNIILFIRICSVDFIKKNSNTGCEVRRKIAFLRPKYCSFLHILSVYETFWMVFFQWDMWLEHKFDFSAEMDKEILYMEIYKATNGIPFYSFPPTHLQLLLVCYFDVWLINFCCVWRISDYFW